MVSLFSSSGTPVRDNWNLSVFPSFGTLCLQCSFWQVLYFCVACEWAPSDSGLSGSPKFAIYIWLLLEGLWISILPLFLSLCLCTCVLFFQYFFVCIFIFLCLCLCTLVSLSCAHGIHTCSGLRTFFKSWFSLFTVWTQDCSQVLDFRESTFVSHQPSCCTEILLLVWGLSF